MTARQIAMLGAIGDIVALGKYPSHAAIQRAMNLRWPNQVNRELAELRRIGKVRRVDGKLELVGPSA